MPPPDLHQTPVTRRRPAWHPPILLVCKTSMHCNSKHSSTILCSILCNMLNCFEGGDPVLPETQSSISAFIIRGRANYIFLLPRIKPPVNYVLHKASSAGRTFAASCPFVLLLLLLPLTAAAACDELLKTRHLPPQSMDETCCFAFGC